MSNRSLIITVVVVIILIVILIVIWRDDNRKPLATKASSRQKKQLVKATNTSCAYRKCDDFVCDRFECIGLRYLNPSKATMTKLVYDQWRQQYQIFNTMFVMEVQKEFAIDINNVYPGTELAPGSLVYGYNNDQTLDLYGGKAKSYNAGFQFFNLKYHGLKQSEYVANTASNVKRYFDRLVSYYAQRGFPLDRRDTTPQFSDQFLYVKSSPIPSEVSTLTSDLFLSIRLIYGSGQLPTHVDLIAQNSGVLMIMDTYLANQASYQNSHLYPIRIPVTTDFCGRFHQKYDLEPIAYYDTICNKLTIHVPDRSAGYFLGFVDYEVPGTANVMDKEVYLQSFDASFAVVNRDRMNDLVPCKPRVARYLVQESDYVLAKTLVVENGSSQSFFEESIRGEYTTGANKESFSGVVCSLLNGESPSFDVYSIKPDVLSSYMWDVNPLQFPADGTYDKGDNTATKLVEKYGNAGSTVFYDNPTWKQTIYGLPIPAFSGSAYPEQRSLSSAPRLFQVSDELAYYSVAVHEYAHESQTLTGGITFGPTEAWATAIEMDPKASLGTYDIGFRPPVICSYALRATRGDFTPMLSDNSGASTYGSAYFWVYLREQFDENNQLMRRIPEILTSGDFADQLRAANIVTPSQLIISNETGGNLAFDQALGELYGKNLPDVFSDFLVSTTMLRNNTGIPPQYRHQFPHWISSASYVDFAIRKSAAAVEGSIGTVDWWDYLDENRRVIPGVNSLSAGQTFVRTLPLTFEADVGNMRGYAFAIPAGTTYVDLHVPSGQWRITLVQFTSNGTQAGIFKQDPAPGQFYELSGGDSHSFDIAANLPGFTPNGVLKLVCVHVSLDAYGDLRDFYGVRELTGRIEIQRDGPVVNEDSLSVKIGPYSFKCAYTTGGPRVSGILSAPGATMIPADACSTVSTNLAGKIGVVQRSGACSSSRFVLNSQATGAVGTLIITSPGTPIDIYGGSDSATGPSLVITPEDGATLLSYLALNPGAIIDFVDPFN